LASLHVHTNMCTPIRHTHPLSHPHIKLQHTSHGSLDAILAAADARQLSSLGPKVNAALSAAAGRETALRNLTLLTLAARQQQVPAAAQAAVRERLEAAQTAAAAAVEQQPDEAQIVRLHPSIGARWERYAGHLDAVSRALSDQLQLPHAARWVCRQTGLPLDLVVRLRCAEGRLMPALQLVEGEGGEQEGVSGMFDQRDCVAVLLVGPSDVSAPASPPPAASPPPPLAAAAASPTPPVAAAAAAPRKKVRPLAQLLSSGASRRYALIKRCGWRVALVPVEGLTEDTLRSALLGALGVK